MKEDVFNTSIRKFYLTAFSTVSAQTRHGQPRPDERLSRSPSEAGSGLTEKPADANRPSTAQ